MLNTKEFGTLIASRRREIGMTQEAFAAMLGITPQAISKWENGVGYPDVTLFPDIARSLDISLEMLFGTQMTDAVQKEPVSVVLAPPAAIPLSPNVPPEHCSLPPVAAGSHFICYSDKALAERGEDANIVRFTDGSRADLASGEVENFGTGEIRMLPVVNGYADHPQRDNTPQVRAEDFLYFHSVQLLCRGSGEVTVKTSPDEQGHMEARGPVDFLDSVSAFVKDETLTLDIAPNGSGDTKGREITIWLPVASGGQLNAHITGCCKVQCEPAFSHTAILINGCGELHGSRTQTMTANVSGCGNIHWGSAEENTSITVSGCGDVTVDYAANPHVNISGSGEVTLRQVSGSMSVTVGGSGDVTASGELDTFSCHLDGAATVHGEQLSVSEASITINSTGTVKLGRIRNHSKEKLGQAATLTVDHRGNPVGGTAKLPLH